MNMSHTERLILSNQYEILSKLNPEQADVYQRAKTIIERGYCLQLLELEKSFGHLERDTCQEVIDTLEMHHAMMVSFENLPTTEQAEFTPARFKFNGYSRSQERELADYVCFLLEVDKRFPEVDCPCEELSSDIAMRDKYQRMLAAWRDCPRSYKLSIQELRKILNA
ncbi:YfbU family protein [Aeromonas simiae]|uniref:YfbU family protein n=1 Tax=Aeromonas simiae TaxID=218936 RepID=A0A5J6WV41_9GAMM|nr:YfbU family protein [Aeromonas simiae]QFI53728.1 YfbU family protein [Aeromonas simiae]